MNMKPWMKWAALLLAAGMCFGAGCSDDDGHDDSEGDSTEIENDTSELDDSQPAAQFEGVTRCLVIGDGISKGVGLTEGSPWPTLLRRKLRVEVPVNAIGGAGVGDGAGKIQSLIDSTAPSHVLILLGEDDVVNGTPLTEIWAHFKTMVDVARLNGVIPAISTLPPLYGFSADVTAYEKEVNDLIRDFAAEYWVRLADLEDEFGTDQSLIQADGIHPASYGHVIIMEAFYDTLP